MGGLLVNTARPSLNALSLKFTIKLYWIQTMRPIDLSGEGEVVRVESLGAERFAIAIKCSQPINQMEAHL
jgi:hypothetical protein